ncbi:MAG: hypothetical protein ACTH1Z_02745 [Ancrocorticia sp.]|uniref:hypothetical protein n=1 Tax=Ancrocorticia sp. TaxID=2593684 RepID=UPI003F91E9E6
MGIRSKAAQFAGSRRVDALSAVIMSVFLVPQLILRVMPSSQSQFAAVGAMALSSVLAFAALVIQDRVLPRSSNPRLVATYIGERTGVVLSSARFVSYSLIIVLGAGLFSQALSSVVDLGGHERLVAVGVVVVMALPGIAGRTAPVLLLYGSLVLAIVSLGAVLIYGLIADTSGGYSQQTLEATREYMSQAPPNGTGPFSVGAVALAGMVPAGILILTIDRRAVQSDDRSKNFKVQGARALIAFIAILVTLYFGSSLAMASRTRALPTLAMAYGFFGEAGHIVLAVAAMVAGVCAVIAAYGVLPRLVHDLSVDRMLPRHYATEHSSRPRVVAISITAGLAALVSGILTTVQAAAMVFVFATLVIFTLWCAAMTFRGSAILRESVDRGERQRARRSRWIFGPCSVVGMVGLFAIAWVSIWWALSAIVTLALPSGMLIFFRRGRVQVVRRLAATDLTAGRALPTRVHGIILVSALDLPTLRAVSFARASRLTSLSAVTLDFDPRATKKLRNDWKAAALPVDLTVLGTPEGAGPQNVVDYVQSMRHAQRADIVTVFFPRVIPTGVWQRFFVRHSEPRIMSDLRLQEGVVMAEVPYQLQPHDED